MTLTPEAEHYLATADPRHQGWLAAAMADLKQVSPISISIVDHLGRDQAFAAHLVKKAAAALDPGMEVKLFSFAPIGAGMVFSLFIDQAGREVVHTYYYAVSFNYSMLTYVEGSQP